MLKKYASYLLKKWFLFIQQMLNEEEKEPPLLHIYTHIGRHVSIRNERLAILSAGEITWISFSPNLSARPEMCACRQRECNCRQPQYKAQSNRKKCGCFVLTNKGEQDWASLIALQSFSRQSSATMSLRLGPKDLVSTCRTNSQETISSAWFHAQTEVGALECLEHLGQQANSGKPL